MYDIIAYLGNSLIQHGPVNDRVYLIKLAAKDFPQIINELDKLARQKGYSKLFAKIPNYAKESFLEAGYAIEADIPGFYNGKEDAYFLGKYFSEARKHSSNNALIKDVLLASKEKYKKEPEYMQVAEGFLIRRCLNADIDKITELYKNTFSTYPFPVFDPLYIERTMQSNVAYFGIWHNEDLIALASAEMDIKSQNAEMTDFATHPEYRGHGLASLLLQHAENYVKKLGLITSYTIARSVSYGMNITFAKQGYTYSGTLINNTNICGSLESMNVWYKYL